MIDLRPKIAKEITKSFLNYLSDLGIDRCLLADQNAMTVEVIEEEITKLTLSKLDGNLIPFDGMSSREPMVVAAYLEKYPVLLPYLEEYRAKVKEIDHEAEVLLHVSRDPEMCGVCSEKQTLGLSVRWTHVDEEGFCNEQREALIDAMIDAKTRSDEVSLLTFNSWL